MKLVTIIGARPQFIKAAAVSRTISENNQTLSNGNYLTEIIIHTGQHYDDNMNDIFFRELKIPKPDYFLGIQGLSHGAMTGQMMEKIEEALLNERPDVVLVYGDTNSTLAGALAASKLHIPVAHVEAGLRSFNRRMPEEINRILTDHASSLLFCPTDASVNNLKREGITEGVFKVGDVMYDAFLFYKELSENHSNILDKLQLEPKNYCLCTVHREENTEDPIRLLNLFRAFEELASRDCPYIVPLHPRTKKALENQKRINRSCPNVHLLPPVGYLDMVALEVNALVILTDSGGVQKEAFFAKVPCVTLREETEWIETIETGWNRLGGANRDRIIHAFEKAISFVPSEQVELYGKGNASHLILDYLISC